jgi:hypothetical protein
MWGPRVNVKRVRVVEDGPIQSPIGNRVLRAAAAAL